MSKPFDIGLLLGFRTSQTTLRAPFPHLCHHLMSRGRKTVEERVGSEPEAESCFGDLIEMGDGACAYAGVTLAVFG